MVFCYCRQFADDASALGTIANDNPLSPLAEFWTYRVGKLQAIQGPPEMLKKIERFVSGPKDFV
jgi:hypothetical protein